MGINYNMVSEPGPNNDGFHLRSSRGRDLSSKLSLPIFGLVFHKLKAEVWDPDGVSEGQKANSLLRAADNWIKLLQVNHPDYNYFMSHYPYWR
ncbi:Transducin/WD40 repeat superfamily protein [Spatholobus suberectus]|nr:Transducin/WD40 repeat superfamily protein [Spatholobus suberectus]